MSESLSNLKIPVLYSFRRCPYAIRARMAIAYAGISVELREVVLRHKPETMLALSPKGTVPILQLTSGGVIDESLDIMVWAIEQCDQDGWLDESKHSPADSSTLIAWNDGEFKYFLDRYKYADRFPEHGQNHYRTKALVFLDELERRLSTCDFLCSADLSFTDIAVFPFIRQFAAVDKDWFEASDYRSVARWLSRLLESDLFIHVMQKYKPWSPEKSNSVSFGGDFGISELDLEVNRSVLN